MSYRWINQSRLTNALHCIHRKGKGELVHHISPAYTWHFSPSSPPLPTHLSQTLPLGHLTPLPFIHGDMITAPLDLLHSISTSRSPPKNAETHKIGAISRCRQRSLAGPSGPIKDLWRHRSHTTVRIKIVCVSRFTRQTNTQSRRDYLVTVHYVGVCTRTNCYNKVANKTNMVKGKPLKDIGIGASVASQYQMILLYSSVFKTGMPAAAAMLERALDAIQPGRILILLGVPDWMNWLQDDTFERLVSLGCRLGLHGAQGEPSLLVTHKGHRRLAEMLITVDPEKIEDQLVDIAPVLFALNAPSCKWHQDPSYSARATFCQMYDGYGDFCDCHQPLHISPKYAVMFPPRMKLDISDDEIQTIPIALVTAKRLTNVLRQVQQLWSIPGGGVTPLAIFVDGYNPEAEQLGNILNITTIFHYNNPAPIGSKHRVNQHIKFSLKGILQLYSDVDKVIILEDDLVLASDFISYFHQAAILLDFESDSLMCVNAYNYNAFPHSAHDPSKIYRVQSYPYYGWMVKRKEAESMLKNWAPLHVDADWDYFLRKMHLKERQVIIPEIPRTRHEGGGGMHVSGVIQELTYNQRPLNMIPNVTLDLRRTWLFAYSLDMQRALDEATFINITHHPCEKEPIPRNKNSTYVIYIRVLGETDKPHAWKLIAKCLGFYPDVYEHFHGIYSVKFFSATLYVVGCPASPYCNEFQIDPSIIYTPTAEEFGYTHRHQWIRSNLTAEIAVRIKPQYPQEEFALTNFIYY
ncbi:unnamed protein product, partial [Meganyctiphanes norvegica]